MAEKRDLVPSAVDHEWSWTRGFEPYPFEIDRVWEFDEAAERFLARFRVIRANIDQAQL